MFDKIKETIEKVSKFEISDERKLVLQPLVAYIQKKKDNQLPIRLNCICTHNSRRSHLTQVWSQTMATFFKISNVTSYSGGTEATVMFYKVVETLIHQGFFIEKICDSHNPIFAIKYDSNEPAIIGFSKIFDASFNPAKDFAAIMTCSSADEGCPFIPGAEVRLPIRYNDPKMYDGTDLMNQKYEERSLEIASEMYYVFSNIK